MAVSGISRAEMMSVRAKKFLSGVHGPGDAVSVGQHCIQEDEAMACLKRDGSEWCRTLFVIPWGRSIRSTSGRLSADMMVMFPTLCQHKTCSNSSEA